LKQDEKLNKELEDITFKPAIIENSKSPLKRAKKRFMLEG